jgi:hypothetical protein
MHMPNFRQINISKRLKTLNVEVIVFFVSLCSVLQCTIFNFTNIFFDQDVHLGEAVVAMRRWLQGLSQFLTQNVKMIAARIDTTIRDVGQGQSVEIGDKHFEDVKEFVYLGSLMTPANDVSLEVQRRIQTANRCFFGLRKHLQSSHLSRQTKFTIHKTLIRPVLLYGSKT